MKDEFGLKETGRILKKTEADLKKNLNFKFDFEKKQKKDKKKKQKHKDPALISVAQKKQFKKDAENIKKIYREIERIAQDLKNSKLGKLIGKKIQERKDRKEAKESLVSYGRETGMELNSDPLIAYGETSGYGIPPKRSIADRIRKAIKKK